MPVWLCNSSNVSEHGVAQHCVPAVVYVAQDEWISGGEWVTASHGLKFKQLFFVLPHVCVRDQEVFSSCWRFPLSFTVNPALS